jgi:hypothetical protein
MNDEPESASNSIRTELEELDKCLKNPNIQKVLKVLLAAEETCIRQVQDVPLEGVHDLFNREQLIGEPRGLRRFAVEINDIREELIDKITKLEEPQQESAVTNEKDDHDIY